MKRSRIASLDIAKGITIGIVVLFHLPRVGQLTYFNLWGGSNSDCIYADIFFNKRNIA